MNNTENGKLIFLSKNEKIFGPFTPRDIEKLKASGEWQTFHWIYHESQKTWLPLEAAPLKNPETPKTTFADFGQNMSAICHNFKEAFSGEITNLSPLGCEVPSFAKEEAPLFNKNEKIIVNLFSEKLNQTANIHAEVEDYYKVAGQWHYILQWQNCPSIFLK